MAVWRCGHLRTAENSTLDKRPRCATCAKAYRKAYQATAAFQKKNRRAWDKNGRVYQWRRQGINLTAEGYEILAVAQAGLCAICGTAPTEKTQRGCSKRSFALVPDHDHTTGYVRGLLCDRCNKGIALLCDDPAILLSAATYLELQKKDEVA